MRLGAGAGLPGARAPTSQILGLLNDAVATGRLALGLLRKTFFTRMAQR